VPCPKCRSPVCWAEVGDTQLTGPEIIHETTEKIMRIQQHLQAARDRQRNYANSYATVLFDSGANYSFISTKFVPILNVKPSTLRPGYVTEVANGNVRKMSTAYHPQTDGQSERTIKTLDDMFKACVIDFGASRDTHLPLAEFSYNNSYHLSIRCAPFEALYGRKCRKERVKSRRVRAMSMTVQSSVKDKIWVTQDEASKVENTAAEMLRGLDQQIENKEDRGLYFIDRIWVPLVGNVRKMSTAYHPQTDGQSKRTIKTLDDMFKACVIDFGASWDTHLPLAEFSYNNSYHLSIRCAPFEAFYGRKCRSPVLWAEVGEN
nr:putative reverse transcriptase domain-containing protein [Tanacetum cinerariifolium]